MNDFTEQQKKFIEDMVDREIKEQLGGGLFTLRKTTDTPPDSLSVVNRRYVTLNGVTAQRPTTSVIGQQYFDTTLASGRGKTVTWNGIGFVDGTGSYV